jgi:deoxyribose-phosphate aldolase
MTIPDVRLDPAQLAACMDHTLLKPTASRGEITRLCDEARRFGFKGVCVGPAWLETAVACLAESAVLPVTVVGFPLGHETTATKVFATAEAVRLGAREIDTVLNLGRLKSQDWAAVEADCRAVVEAASGHAVKAILETALLTHDEILKATECAIRAGAAYVKTSTGFGPGGASVDAVRLLKAAAGDRAKVKAAGGIRTLAEARAMLAAGADRLGTSSSVPIVTEARTAREAR